MFANLDGLHGPAGLREDLNAREPDVVAVAPRGPDVQREAPASRQFRDRELAHVLLPVHSQRNTKILRYEFYLYFINIK